MKNWYELWSVSPQSAILKTVRLQEYSIGRHERNIH